MKAAASSCKTGGGEIHFKVENALVWIPVPPTFITAFAYSLRTQTERATEIFRRLRGGSRVLLRNPRGTVPVPTVQSAVGYRLARTQEISPARTYTDCRPGNIFTLCEFGCLSGTVSKSEVRYLSERGIPLVSQQYLSGIIPSISHQYPIGIVAQIER